MQYRKLGQSDITVPVVSFGAWAVGGWQWAGADDAESIGAIQRGIDLGMTCIDTAPVYGQGHSEEVVGKAIEGRRDEVCIATKCGFRWDLDRPDAQGFDTRTTSGQNLRVVHCLRPESIRHEVNCSLARLKVDVIDVYQCHAPDPDTPVDDTMATLVELRDAGKIREIGVSNFKNDLLHRARELAPLVSSQSMYNLILRDVEDDELPFCREHGMGLIAYTPLLLGLLTGKVGMERTFPEGDLRRGHHLFTPGFRKKVLNMLDSLSRIAKKHNATFAQLAIAWVAAQPGVATVLAGARNKTQAEENARAGDIQLDAADVAAMREAAEDALAD